MSTELHATPRQHPHEPTMTPADWFEDVAVGVMLIAAFAIIAAIVALLIVV